MKHKNNQGMTLVELLVVIGIIAVIILASIPLFSSVKPKIILDNEARQLVVDLRLAQQLTITKKVTHEVRFDGVNNSYLVYRMGDTEEVIKKVDLDPNIDFAEINLTGAKAVFNTIGGALEAGSIKLINNHDQMVVINIKSSGFIEITE